MAVSHADTILHWRENLLADEMPPEWMWPFPDELNKWFEQVELDREARAKGEDPGEHLERNELAKHWR